MEQIRPNKISGAKDYFSNFTNTTHKQYDALRAFFYDGMKAEEVAVKNVK